MGDVKLTVTQINAGKQHNVVPADVDLVIDVRVNDKYTNAEIAEFLQKNAPCDSIVPSSLHLNSSSIPVDHPLVQAGIAIGKNNVWFTNVVRSSMVVVSVFKIRAW